MTLSTTASLLFRSVVHIIATEFRSKLSKRQKTILITSPAQYPANCHYQARNNSNAQPSHTPPTSMGIAYVETYLNTKEHRHTWTPLFQPWLHPLSRMICACLQTRSPVLKRPIFMRVSITHHTIRKGLLFKKTYYEVHLTVAFTHEEKQIIKQRGLLKTKLVDRRPAEPSLVCRRLITSCHATISNVLSCA